MLSVSLATALALAPTLFQDDAWQPWKHPTEYAIVFAAGAVSQFLERATRSSPAFRITIVLAVKGAVLALAFWLFRWSAFGLGLWIYLVAAFTALAVAWASNVRGLARAVSVESFLFLIGGGWRVMYSVSVFSRIPPWLGGGASSRAELSLREPLLHVQ